MKRETFAFVGSVRVRVRGVKVAVTFYVPDGSHGFKLASRTDASRNPDAVRWEVVTTRFAGDNPTGFLYRTDATATASRPDALARFADDGRKCNRELWRVDGKAFTRTDMF